MFRNYNPFMLVSINFQVLIDFITICRVKPTKLSAFLIKLYYICCLHCFQRYMVLNFVFQLIALKCNHWNYFDLSCIKAYYTSYIILAA